MQRLLVSLIAAVARDGGIGNDGELLVRLPEDMRRFKALTMGAAIVMGRKTWQSIGRPLPGRRNLVLSRNEDWRAEGAERVGSLEAALGVAAADAPRLFVIGGAEIYAVALPRADELELTEIDAAFAADTFFPRWDRSTFEETARETRETEDGLRYAFASYRRLTSRRDPAPESCA